MPLVFTKDFRMLKVDLVRQRTVVAEDGMHIQRQVGGVQSQFGLDHARQFVVMRSPYRLQPTPENAVVHEHHLAIAFDGHFDGRLTRVHCQPYLADGAGILHLQAVHRAG